MACDAAAAADDDFPYPAGDSVGGCTAVRIQLTRKLERRLVSTLEPEIAIAILPGNFLILSLFSLQMEMGSTCTATTRWCCA